MAIDPPDTLRIDRASATEMQVTRYFAASPALVYATWAGTDLFQRWWVPASYGITLLSCDMDVRTGGSYRLEFAGTDGPNPVFFGRYLEVVPDARLVWSNDEPGGGHVTTVTFAADGDGTLVTYSEVHPSAAALEYALAGSAQAMPEQFAALDSVLAAAPAGSMA